MMYSLDQIDEMRRLTEERICSETGFFSSQVSPVAVEERLRTYLANGVTLHEMREAREQIVKKLEAKEAQLDQILGH